MPTIFDFPAFTGDPQNTDLIHIGDNSDQLDKKGTVDKFIRFIKGLGAHSTKLIDGGGSATNSYDVSIGQGTVASGGNSYAGSENAVASGANSFAHGNAATSSGVHTWSSGLRALAARYGEWARSSFRFTSNGDAQIMMFHLANQTAVVGPTPLFLDGSGSTQGITLSDNSVVTVQALVCGRNIAASEVAGYRFTGCIKRDVGAGTIAIVGAINKQVLGEDVAAWDANLGADPVSGAISVTVTGEAAKTINWGAKIDMTHINI